MMNNEEEKRCPLCAEEMDWTDQQFKPCKCGYQVCVWCWHQIIDMAEKDETEGRCPACRVVYEKDKIVAAQTNCERAISKNPNRKTRPPKAKPKTYEVNKDLTNVRVIQRKMAYVIGLPLCLADEDMLQQKEYFGQYGKITKVSLSRTAGGTIQQFVNDTFSVYITFSKKEEALRCIRWVHGFVLEGRYLKASFGTAKYCHAWLKNTSCSNSACLYLHSIGADEDSFGKDEAASVHTRNRVQEMAGIGNLWVKRSGSILPQPVDDLYNSTSTIPEKYTIESSVSDEAHGSTNSSIETTCSLPSREREESIAIPQKVTSFVDIVGRSNSSAPERDGNIPEDKRILQLDSEISSASIGGDIDPMEPYSVPNTFNVSSCNHIGNGLFKNIPNKPLQDDSHLFYSQGSKDTITSSQGACFLQPSNSASILEAAGSASLHKKTHSLNYINVVQNAVYNHDAGALLPIKCVNTALNDVCHEMKFQNSTKSDRIYRNSNSFSNEEILEHLRRIDGDNLTNDEEDSALNVVESSIISNIMSIDFDSCEDSLTIPGGLSQMTDGVHDSSWNSFNSDQLGYSFVKQSGFVCQSSGSVRPEFGDGKDKYLSKSPYPGTRTQSLAPPGFSVPSRDLPPGFSTCERTGFLPRASSGGHLGNSSFSSNLLQQQPHPTGGELSSSSIDNVVDFIDPAILSCGKPTNEVKAPGGFEMKLPPDGGNIISPPQINTFEDNAKLWLLIQQSATAKNRDSNYSQMFARPQTSPNYISSSHHIGNGVSALENMYGGLSSSRPVDLHQNYNPSSYPQLPHQKYVNGHISSNNNNTNGYLHSSMAEFRHKGEAGGMTELERNERLGGINKYFLGYGDSMFSSVDLYNRLFGL